MDNIEIAIVGYISGALIGGFIILVALTYAYLHVNEKSIHDVEFISNIYELLLTYYETSATVFSVSFLIGFLSGTGYFARRASK